VVALVDDGRGLPMIASSATPRQLEDFRHGFCHFLALELHDRHGWRLRALGSSLPADEYSISPWRGLNSAPSHIYCLREDGLPVDVNGVFASEAAIRRFYADQHNHDEALLSVDVSAEDVRGELCERYHYRQPYDFEVELTRKDADVLALHELGYALS
jgi:hypothetical protein